MSVLLDTHYVYALAGAPGRLSKSEERFLDRNRERFSVSAVSIWEMRLKWSTLTRSGKRKGPMSAAHAMQALDTQRINWLALTPVHAAASLIAPIEHKDPFDELLLTQAQVEGLKLLSRDSALSEHPLVISV